MKQALRGAFINTENASCSIFESGRMVYNCIRDSTEYSLDYFSLDMFDRALFAQHGKIKLHDRASIEIDTSYDFWVFNWHFFTMLEVTRHTLSCLQGLKFSIILELEPDDPFAHVPEDMFDGYIALDPSARQAGRVTPFPRPLEGNSLAASKQISSVPKIGSFGFGTPGKGFELLVEAVNREFDQAVVRINIPVGSYTSWTERIHGKNYASHIEEVCRRIAKPSVEVRFSHEFMRPEQLVYWCAANDLNCFMYTRRQSGLSATTDQAIMSGRPLLTSSNDTFRHIHRFVPPYPILSLREAMEKTAPLVRKMQKAWSRRVFSETFRRMLVSHGLLRKRDRSTRVARPIRPRIAVASRGVSDARGIYSYTRRVADSLKRSNKYDVQMLIFENVGDLVEKVELGGFVCLILDEKDVGGIGKSRAVSFRSDVKVIVLSSTGEGLVSDQYLQLARKPIIPYFTSTDGLSTPRRRIWLVGFSGAHSNLEQIVAKIAEEDSEADLLIEDAGAEDVSTLARRLAAMEKKCRSADIQSIYSEKPAHVVRELSESHLSIFYNDPSRTEQLLDICALALTTERAVCFTKGAPFPELGDGTTYIENHSIVKVIEMGVSAQIKLYQDFGEWQTFARIDRALISALSLK